MQGGLGLQTRVPNPITRTSEFLSSAALDMSEDTRHIVTDKGVRELDDRVRSYGWRVSEY